MTAKPAAHPLRELAMKIRYELTGAQGLLTELIRQVDELGLEPRPLTRTDRNIAKAQASIAAGEWDGLSETMFDVELDLLAVPQVDRHDLRRRHAARPSVPSEPQSASGSHPTEAGVTPRERPGSADATDGGRHGSAGGAIQGEKGLTK